MPPLEVIQVFLEPEVQLEFLGVYGAGGLLSPRSDVQYPADWPDMNDLGAMAISPLSTWGIVTPALSEIDQKVGPMMLEAVQGKRALGPTLEEADRLFFVFLVEKHH